MALTGNLSDIDVTALAEWTRQSAEYATLVLCEDAQTWVLYFSRGEVVHAVCGAQEGTEVVLAALQRRSGTFELERGGLPPPHITIQTPWNTLLLQSLQHIDENNPAPKEDSQPMVTKEKPEDILREMANDLEPGLHGMGVVGGDGMGIAFYKVSGTAAEMLGAQIALIMQLARRSAERLEKSAIEDVLVTTEKSYLLGRHLGDTQFFLVVSIDRDSVLGNVRLTMRNNADRLARVIPGSH